MSDFKQIQSVVLCYGLDDCTESLVRSECKRVSLTAYFYQELSPLRASIGSSTHLFGIIIQEDNAITEEFEFLKQYRKILGFVSNSKANPFDFEMRQLFSSSPQKEDIQEYLAELKEYQKHPDLANWMEKCASFLMPFKISGETIAFKETVSSEWNCGQVYYTNLTLNPYIARIELHVDVERSSKTLFESLGLQGRLIHDFFKEMVNQYSGIITRPFLNHFLEPSLEVPYMALYDDIQKEFSQIVLPFSCVCDQFEMFKFKVAFIHVEGGCPFRAPMDPAWDPIQTLEFL